MSLWKRLFVVAALVVFLCVALVIGHERWLPPMMSWLDVGEVPQRSDAVFVLLGDSDARPFVAAAMYNAGLADEVLLAKFLPVEVDPYELRSDLVNKHILMRRGVPESAIRLLGDAGITNTMNESATLGEYLTQHPTAMVTVVTSNFHTRRTRWSMRQNLGAKAERLRYVSAPYRSFQETNWWLDARGFQLIWMEYVKLFGYWFVYGDGIYWVAGSLLTLVGGGYLIRKRRAVLVDSTLLDSAKRSD